MKCRAMCDCEFSEKILYSAFLALIGTGYLMALVYLYTTYQSVDGKPGLSVEDIAENYYGNRSGSRLEAAIRGPMSNYIQLDERNRVVDWLISGADEVGYNNIVRPIFANRCFGCHSPESGLPVPDFTHYAGVSDVTNIDTGVSIHTLMRVSHIHLFGIGLVLLGVGIIFRRVVMRSWLKSTLIILPFAAIFIDILAWFLTKWDPLYAYIIVITGAVLGLSLAVQILSSLYQMWFIKPESISDECKEC